MPTIPERVTALETEFKNFLKKSDEREQERDKYVTRDELAVAMSTFSKDTLKDVLVEVLPPLLRQKSKSFSTNLKTILWFVAAIVASVLSFLAGKGITP